jgi:hypothetical protein
MGPKPQKITITNVRSSDYVVNNAYPFTAFLAIIQIQMKQYILPYYLLIFYGFSNSLNMDCAGHPLKNYTDITATVIRNINFIWML